MDEREHQRKARHRLAILRHAEEVSGNVAATCRYFGISRQCFYIWKRRYDELGEAGLRDGDGPPALQNEDHACAALRWQSAKQTYRRAIRGREQ